MFSNVITYQIVEADFSDLEAKLAAMPFHPCQSLDPLRYGFVPAVGSEYAHRILSGETLICAKKQVKLLPGGAVKEAVDAKVAELSQAESRPVGRKERQALKDEMIFSMLPNAPTKSRLTYAYIAGDLLVVGAAARSEAEDLCSKLREALGSLKLVPVATHSSIEQVFTNAACGHVGLGRFEFGNEVELLGTKHGEIVRGKNVDITGAEIQSHISSGMLITKARVSFCETASVTVCNDLSLKRIVLPGADTGGSPEEQKSSEFAATCVQLGALLAGLFHLLGGRVA